MLFRSFSFSVLSTRTLFHEYTHALVYSVTPVCPRWIHEGLAEYCSGSRPPRIGQIIPLERLENASAWWNGESAPLVHLLFASKQGSHAPLDKS